MEVVVTEARNREENRQIIPFPVNLEKWKRMDYCVDWNALPEDLLARILSRLPFSSLVRSRGVCRKWRDLALSPAFTFSGNLASKCVPIYFYEGPLQVYNSKSNAWEKQSLEFLGVPSASLALLVSAGGLLCFKNKVSGDFVVCNPITKRWRLVQLPPGFDHGAIQSPQPGREWIVPEPDTSSKKILSQEDERVAEFFRSFGREGIVGLLTEKYERNYKLIVAGLRHGDSQHRPTLIFDSLTSSWTRGSEVPSGVRFWESGKPIYFKGTFYCVTWSKGFSPESCSLRRPWSVVKYSVKKDYWSEYHSNTSSATIPQLVEFRERGYLVQKHIHDISTLLFGELERPEREARLIEKCREAKIPTMGDWCIGQGDCLYFGGCGKEQHKHLGFSVLVHDLTRRTSVWSRLPRLFDHASCKYLELPKGFGVDAITDPLPHLLKPVVTLEGGKETIDAYQRSLGKQVIVGLITERHKQWYKLVVAGICNDENTERATLVYDSFTDRWSKGAEVHKGARFWESGKTVNVDGSLYCITFTAGLPKGTCSLVWPWSIVRYNSYKDCWSEIHLARRSSVMPQLVEHRGRILVIQRNGITESEIFFSELKEDEPMRFLTIRQLPSNLFPPKPGKRCPMIMEDWCVGQGDCLYIAGRYRENDADIACPRGLVVLAHSFTEDTWIRLPTMADASTLRGHFSAALHGFHDATWLRAFEPSLGAKV